MLFFLFCFVLPLLSVVKKKKKHKFSKTDVTTTGACLEPSQGSCVQERERKEAVCAGVCSLKNTEFQVSAKMCVCEWTAARL